MDYNVCVICICLLSVLHVIVGGHYEFGCDEKMVPGNCSDAIFPKFYFDKESNQCKLGSFSNCPASLNVFDLKSECDERCVKDFSYNCSEPKQAGNCGFKYTKWYYNETNDTCKQFLYTGCNGNTNRFVSQEECDHFCRNPTEKGQDCDLPLAKGSCSRGYTKEWYFDPVLGCTLFRYSGCEGNNNRFKSLENCQRKCEIQKHHTRVENCKLKLDRGSKIDGKLTNETRYYFSIETMKCESFHYRGIDGNANNFISMKTCQDTCPEEMMKKEHVPETDKRTTTKSGDNSAMDSVPEISNIVLFMSIVFIFSKFNC